MSYIRDFMELLYIDGLVQERRNSSALAIELCLSCTYPLIYSAENQIYLALIFIVATKVNHLHIGPWEMWL